MKRLWVALGVIAAASLAALPFAVADQPPSKTFDAALSEDEEVPLCAPATNASGGNANFHVRDDGTVDFRLVANNLPGTVSLAHIHIAPVGVPGPIVQNLAPPFRKTENGIVATGSFTNPPLVAAIRANPQNYYVNIHSDVCPMGVIRGQLDEHGPMNN
jgi:hypothetical protein